MKNITFSDGKRPDILLKNIWFCRHKHIWKMLKQSWTVVSRFAAIASHHHHSLLLLSESIWYKFNITAFCKNIRCQLFIVFCSIVHFEEVTKVSWPHSNYIPSYNYGKSCLVSSLFTKWVGLGDNLLFLHVCIVITRKHKIHTSAAVRWPARPAVRHHSLISPRGYRR